MVIDKIENYRLYSQLTQRLTKGFEFITTTDLKAIASGKHEIDSEAVFAIVQEYDTKDEFFFWEVVNQVLNIMLYFGWFHFFDLQFAIFFARY